MRHSDESSLTVPIPNLWKQWRRFAEVGRVIDCPSMTLIAADHDAPIVVGGGQVTVTSSSEWHYVLTGTPADFGHALRALNRHKADPYDGRLRSRLDAVSAEGTSLSFGWTTPKAVPQGEGMSWKFFGECGSISADADGTSVPQTTDLFPLPPRHSSRIALRRFMSELDEGVRGWDTEFEGGELSFRLYDDADMMTVMATATKTLPLTYTENWLAEPLRIMFGQLAYPRVVARSQVGGTAVSIRPISRWHADSDAAGLWNTWGRLSDKTTFWRTYETLLRYIATSRGQDGHPQFEPNKITQLYQEVVQAARSTRWIWALAFASAVEGIVLQLKPRDTQPAGSDRTVVHELCRHIDAWKGDHPQLKGIVKNAAHRTLTTSAIQALRGMRDNNDVTAEQFNAWSKLRNQVMHGSLLPPYSSAEGDRLLLDLASLLHAVTRKLVGVA